RDGTASARRQGLPSDVHDRSRRSCDVWYELGRCCRANDGVVAPELIPTRDQLFGNVCCASAQRDRCEWSLGFSPDVHSEFRPSPPAYLDTCQRKRYRGDISSRGDAQLGDRQQSDVGSAEGERISVSVRLFRSIGPCRSTCATSDNARSVRGRVERLQAERKIATRFFSEDRLRLIALAVTCDANSPLCN